MYKIVHPDYGVCVAEVFPAFEFDDFKPGKVINPSELDTTHPPSPGEDYDPAYTYVAIAPKACLEFKVIGMTTPRALLWHERSAVDYVLRGLEGFRVVEQKEESVSSENVVKRKGKRKR